MMRCLQCDREYSESQEFCHQCGEPLQPREASPNRSTARGREEIAARRARALARRRAPARSQSLLFAMLVLLGAGVGLAIVWRQAWIPSVPRVTVNGFRPQDARPSDVAQPSQTSASAPAKVESETAAPLPAMPAPAPAVEPAPAVAVTPSPPVARAPESPAPTAPPSPPKRAPEPATPRVASRPEPPPATADRPALGGSSSQPSTAPKLLSARTDPGAALPTAGTRVISLVPVGGAAKARGQLVWEPIGGGTLVVSGLPQPPVGRTYQLWLGSINLGDRVSAGLLVVDAQGAGTLRVAPPRATWSPDIFGVTMERQGGAREPSDDLVLVGELPKQTAAAPPTMATPPRSTPSESAAAPPSGPGADSASVASVPPTPPVTSTRGPDGQVVRVFSAPVERTWTVAQSVLRSLGWDIDKANQATGVIRTEPRNVTYKDFVFYAEGTRHTLSVVVRAVSDTETSISVRREVFQEERILWTKERKLLATPESSVEQGVLDAIDRVL